MMIGLWYAYWLKSFKQPGLIIHAGPSITVLYCTEYHCSDMYQRLNIHYFMWMLFFLFPKINTKNNNHKLQTDILT